MVCIGHCNSSFQNVDKYILLKVVNYWPKHVNDKLNFVALARKLTITTQQPPLVGEVRANFCG
jgi:hypothetical protein